MTPQESIEKLNQMYESTESEMIRTSCPSPEPTLEYKLMRIDRAIAIHERRLGKDEHRTGKA